MPVHERQRPPAGHGEVLCAPPVGEWAGIARANADAARLWPAPLLELREQARAEAVSAAIGYSHSIGVTPARRDGADLIVMTGHQPELFHPGVWVKEFLVQRLSEEMFALGIDLVVDTDAAGRVELVTPCIDGEVCVCRSLLAEAPPDVAYVQAPPPDDAARVLFRQQGMAALTTLPAPALARHFGLYADALDAVAAEAPDLGTLLTAARRRYERPAGTDYLELPVSVQARTEAMRLFVDGILRDAVRFRQVTNDALAAYRTRTGTRSAAQPFPDLDQLGDLIEVPFWLLADGTRQRLFVGPDGALRAGATPAPSRDASGVGARIVSAPDDALIVPRALALTMFERLFVADLFIHGTGGGRYDRVTDAVIRAYYGIEPPAFVVASMTLLLPLGCTVTTDDDVSLLEQRLNRIEHNPDQALGDVEFDTVAERTRAEDLARQKAELVTAIAAPGADRKSTGIEIRAVNKELSAMLAPLAHDLHAELARARSARDASAVLTDRTYPFCLWDPREVADKVR